MKENLEINWLVGKFGGDANSTPENCNLTAEAITYYSNQKFVVVSAPGKRYDSDVKITTILTRISVLISEGKDWEVEWRKIEERFLYLIDNLLLHSLAGMLPAVKERIKENPYPDFIKAQGEYMQTRIITQLLNFNGPKATFVDAKDFLFLNEDGFVNKVKTKEVLSEIKKTEGIIVVPGFYGVLPNGRIQTLGPNSSDVTAAIITELVDEVDTYINWKKVDGKLRANPNYVSNPEIISEMGYNDERVLADGGSIVLHPEVIKHLAEKKPKVIIKNFEKPELPGTTITWGFQKHNGLLGFSERTNLVLFTVEKVGVQDATGFEEDIFHVFTEEKIPRYDTFSGTDMTPFLVERGHLCPGVKPEEITKEMLYKNVAFLRSKIREAVNPDLLSVHYDVACITCVCSPDVTWRIMHALSMKRIKPIAYNFIKNQFLVVIANEHVPLASRAIYQAFF